ncbi:RpiB/LacA/LacB family sugar-phosphate isomerase [Candidatus Pacearchaeota archaeon]|nr:RpiB/LacA/LacB family sugar-phosphate isomerase [Candidatus Pacearchaeota archaeon]
MKVVIGSDHAGFKLKEKLKVFFDKNKIDYEDVGPYKYDKNDDYPHYSVKVAEKVVKLKCKGVIIGKSGQGEAIASNKVKGIRAMVYYGKDKKIIKLSREHNDSNILSLGAGFLSEKEASEAVKLFLSTKFSNHSRHKRRLNEISKFEKR